MYDWAKRLSLFSVCKSHHNYFDRCENRHELVVQHLIFEV